MAAHSERAAAAARLPLVLAMLLASRGAAACSGMPTVASASFATARPINTSYAFSNVSPRLGAARARHPTHGTRAAPLQRRPRARRRNVPARAPARLSACHRAPRPHPPARQPPVSPYAQPAVMQVFDALAPFTDWRGNANSTYSCVDSRGLEPQLGTFGGDFAELAAAAYM